MKKRQGRAWGLAACMGLVLTVAAAAEDSAASSWAGGILDKCCGGGDIRLRGVSLDNIPPRPENEFMRVRTRLWGQLDAMEGVAVRVRLVNEFRDYDTGDPSDNLGFDFYKFPDELIVDQLYLDLVGLFDGNLDLRIGRQDLIYGTGKVILEGTPLDGSRTIHFDAVKASWKGIEKTTVDFIGIYNQGVNDLAISSEDYNLTGYHPNDEPFDEVGGAVYLKNSSMETLPFEAYYVFKNQEKYVDRRTNTVAKLDLHTLGVRLMPKLSAAVDGAIEAAMQFGEQGDTDLEGVMVDAVLNWRVPCDTLKPSLSAGLYYLSGNDPSSADDEAWHPVWARWPQYSELYVYAWDAEGGAGKWANIMMPHVGLSLAPAEWLKLNGLVGFMRAPENPAANPFLTGDKDRGTLYTARADFTLAKGLFGEKDSLFGHLLAEFVDPGDAYVEQNTMHFLRAELSYAF